MGVLHPVKLILTNYPEDKTETFEVENNPEPSRGRHPHGHVRPRGCTSRPTTSWKTPVKGYFRLFPGNEVRLKTTYVVNCTGCKKDDNGNVVEVYAEYDPESRGGNPADGRKIKSGPSTGWTRRTPKTPKFASMITSLLWKTRMQAISQSF